MLREQPVQLKENLTYEETPLQILDRKEQVLRSKVIPLKLVWSFRGRNVLKKGGFVTPRPDEVHNTCNCKGAYVHQVPL